MKRREFIGGLTGAAVWPLATKAQAPKKMPRLCFLTFDPGTLQANRFEAFFHGMRDLGYVNGQNVEIDYLSAEANSERFPALAEECLRREVDVIVVSTTPAAQVAMAATRTVPIIMIGLGDPVRTGLVKTLVEPGGNVTGLSLMVSEIGAKRLGLLKEALPNITRVLVLTYLADPIAPVQVDALQEAARSRGIKLQVRDIRSADDLPAAFEAAAAENAEALLTTAESIFVAQRARVTELAARYKIPAMYCYSRHVIDAGGLMAYEASYSDVIRRAASYVDRVLKGAKASDLPVGLPIEFEFSINLATAKALGLTIPPAVLAITDKVIE